VWRGANAPSLRSRFAASPIYAGNEVLIDDDRVDSQIHGPRADLLKIISIFSPSADAHTNESFASIGHHKMGDG
jgi:hypothetical protein